jgi:hypothetical protein
MNELRSYLNTTTYDITFILIAYPFTPADSYVQNLIKIQYSVLKLNPTYTLTYEFLTLTSDEIRQFYLANVTTEIPYLVSYKKRYITRDPWWYPCKQVSLSSTKDDISVYIKYSLAPIQRQRVT